MNKSIFRAFPGILAAFCAITPARATVYDAVADFSSLNTASSTWSYRYENGLTRNGSYSLLPSYSTLGLFNPDSAFWNNGSAIPLVGVNRTGSAAHLAIGPDFVWPNGTMLLAPGSSGLVVVSWLSPITSQVNINFSFSDLDPNTGPYLSDGINWYVERNNSSATLSSGGFPNGGASGMQNLTGISVTVGDRINFIVDPKAAPEYDSTQLTAVITPVPEPSVGKLFGLLLILIGIYSWRAPSTQCRAAEGV